MPFRVGQETLTVLIDFKSGSRFEVSVHEDAHPVHDTVTKSYWHLNLFQHECHLQVDPPCVKLPNSSERQMPFAAVARITFDKFHVIGHTSIALDKMRRIEQCTDTSLKGTTDFWRLSTACFRPPNATPAASLASPRSKLSSS